MALICCEECQQTVSHKAASCPHCGAPQGIQRGAAPATPSRNQTQTGLGRKFLGFGLLTILVIMFLNSFNKDSTKQQAVSEEDRIATAKKEAEEEARCNSDLKCLGNKKSIEASFKCAPNVEKLAKNNFEWIDKWYESKFSRFGWKDKNNLVITYVGDKIKFQNGFGAWVLSRYECDYSIPTSTVMDVRASAGRLD
ncbi:zinc ribbon domain-containing protein [Bradyrhizobium sp. 157]|uniref:hypothetical protein n=1 Tax=Bradyrhizobium sp. 157 TaxID=2782631 RepID=UPI001FFA18AA|nr:hypothetical protein [Bradyrhizobium sp. 157]MCK1640471.1 zinc ribbon domain-containing protein [Bradyrhizobium sp. 157]